MEAVSAAASESSRTPLFSPGGFFVLVLVMAVEAVAVWLLAGAFSRPGGVSGTAALPQRPVEVDLGTFVREVSGGDAFGSVPDRFVIQVSLVLNPKLGNLGDLRAMVEGRRNVIKDLISTDILPRLSDADLRKPTVFETLKAEIRKRVNAELSAGPDGADVVDRVIFPESRLPARR